MSKTDPEKKAEKPDRAAPDKHADKQGEKLNPEKSGSEKPGAQRPGAGRGERQLTGIPVSSGIAIGPVHLAAEPVLERIERYVPAAGVAHELARLDSAVRKSRHQIEKLRARLSVLPESSQAEIAPLMDAYMQMLGASRLLREARKRIEALCESAETAVAAQVDLLAEMMLALPGDDAPSRQRRADEIREIGRRLLRILSEKPFRSFANLPMGTILVAENLRPSDAALIDPSRVAGIVAEEGGSDGHTAIMLRALGIPAVLGVDGVMAQIRAGLIAIVDGGAGRVTFAPKPSSLNDAKRGVANYARERQRLGRLRNLPATTADGEHVELAGNLELLAELPLIAQSGAAGIGLFRTEFLFMNRETLPDENEQLEAYRTVIEAMEGETTTIRVLDWGGEKEIEALVAAGIVPDTLDHNPALGVRGVRLLLRRPDLFETQLAAILRASKFGRVRIMLPMVTNAQEVRQAREVMERVAKRLRRKGEKIGDRLPDLGIMVETPGAALSADALALEADFFAIGTNDLAMYALAVDRAASDVASLYDPLHPAVLRLIQFTTEAALRMRMPVSVCGEMAANPKYTPLLLGFGLRSFSMTASAVPKVKQKVRAVMIDNCARLARRVMEQSDPERIAELLENFGPHK